MGSVAKFRAVAHDPDNDYLTGYFWKYDSQNVTSDALGNGSIYTHNITNSDSHTVEAAVLANGLMSEWYSYKFSTKNNKPYKPVLQLIEPASGVIVGNTTDVKLLALPSVYGLDDPDGDIVSYEWYVEGFLQDRANTDNFSFTMSDDLPYNISVRAFDGKLYSDIATFILSSGDLVNYPPKNIVITPSVPSGTMVVSTTNKVNFTATSVDPENDFVDYEWFVGGLESSNNMSSSATGVGNNTIEITLNKKILDIYVRAYDGHHYSNFALMKYSSLPSIPTSPSFVATSGSGSLNVGDIESFKISVDSTDVSGGNISYLWFVDGNAWSDVSADSKVMNNYSNQG